MRTDGLPLDCTAVTISGSRTIARKSYFSASGPADTGVPPFDGLCGEGLLRLFSYGTDDLGNVKYDFEITREFLAVCAEVCAHHDFFDVRRIAEADALLKNCGAKAGKILGLKTSGDAVGNICVYFRADLPCTRPDISDVVREVSIAAGVKESHDCSLPQGEHARLYLVALDFSREWRKAKFYFRFDGRYPPESIARCLAGTESHAPAVAILEQRPLVACLAVALSGDAETYNLYFPPLTDDKRRLM